MERFLNAQWIMANVEDITVKNSYFIYESKFEAVTGRDTVICVSACSQYAVYINGVFVFCSQYDGYENYQIYDTIDVASYIADGENVLQIIQYNIGEDFSTHRIQIPGVIFELYQNGKTVDFSNENCLSARCDGYEFGEMERISPQLGYTFRYDSCKIQSTLQKSILTEKKKNLFPRPVKMLEIDKRVSGKITAQGVFKSAKRNLPIGQIMQESYIAFRKKEDILEETSDKTSWKIRDICDGLFLLLDMYEESVGYIYLDIDVPEESDVLIGYGEHLDDMRVRTFVEDRNFCALYRAKAGHNLFFHPFSRIACRYMQIQIYSCSGTINSIGIRKTWYPVDKQPLNSDNALHKKIYDVGLKTLELCMHEHYEDCPWREQSLYTFDSRIQALCGYYAFKEYEFPKSNLRLMAQSLREDNLLELCSPGKVFVNIPAFSAVFIREVLEYLEYTGDRDFVVELFDTIKKIADGFADRIEDSGLIACYRGDQYWNFYEWTENLKGTFGLNDEFYEAPLNALVSDAFKCFAKICNAVQPKLAKQYIQLHENLNKQIHKYFYSSKKKAYIDRLGNDNARISAFTQAVCLYCGAVPKKKISQIINTMISDDVIPCSLSNSIYEYDVLLSQGKTYVEYVRKQVEKIWGRMLFKGATTFWETEAGASDFNNSGSLCHGWSAVPVYLYGKYGLGIKK